MRKIDYPTELRKARYRLRAEKNVTERLAINAHIKKLEREYLLVLETFAPGCAQALPLEQHRKDEWAVYFLLAPTLRRVKIGVTRNLASRLSWLRSSAPEEYVLLGWIPGGRAAERALHEILKDSRVYGEWFNLTPEVEKKLSAHGIRIEDHDPLFS